MVSIYNRELHVFFTLAVDMAHLVVKSEQLGLFMVLQHLVTHYHWSFMPDS